MLDVLIFLMFNIGLLIAALGNSPTAAGGAFVAAGLFGIASAISSGFAARVAPKDPPSTRIKRRRLSRSGACRAFHAPPPFPSALPPVQHVASSLVRAKGDCE